MVCVISVLQLGTLNYSTGLELQQKLVKLRKEGAIGDVLLLLEHTPVITLGRNAKAKNILASPEALVQRGVEVFECDRGGDVTFHGPGQIVGYPIFDLRGDLRREAFSSDEDAHKTLGAIEYVRRLEEVLIRTCAEFRIPTKRIPGLTGVWTDYPANGQNAPGKTEAKIAAIGVHISRAVTSHGFALNVNTDLSFFNLIVPCGIESKPVTSMERELGRTVPLLDAMHGLARNFGTVFGSQILWLESLEVLLGASLGVPMRPPEELRRLRGQQDTFWA
jgi:lipoyl(octanoyl) transferase